MDDTSKTTAKVVTEDLPESPLSSKIPRGSEVSSTFVAFMDDTARSTNLRPAEPMSTAAKALDRWFKERQKLDAQPRLLEIPNEALVTSAGPLRITGNLTIVGEDGSVTYANRFLKSNAFCAATKTGKISYGEFATDPCRTLFGRVMAIFDPKLTDNCCVNISDYARQAVAFTETSIPIRIAPKTLETLGVFGYRRALRGQISTAHPHYDAVRRCHYNYVADLGMSSIYRLVSIGDNGKQRLVAKIPVKQPAYMHSFGMSADHLVLTEFPLRVNPLDLRLSGKPFIQNYRWEPERGLVFHIVEKDSGRLVRTATADAAFAFHHVNSFAHGEGIDIDVITYPDATIIDQLYLAPLRASAPITATGRHSVAP